MGASGWRGRMRSSSSVTPLGSRHKPKRKGRPYWKLSATSFICGSPGAEGWAEREVESEGNGA